MADREQTVIERMARTRWNAVEGLIRPFKSPWSELSADRRAKEALTMLAAVRELQSIATKAPPALADEYLAIVITDHERRSEVKGGDS